MANWIASLLRRHPSTADLSARADGSIAGRARARVDAHLASCEPCRRRSEELAAVRRLLASLPPPAAPRSFRLSPAMLREAKAAAPRPFPAFQLAAAVAAVALALLLAGDLSTLGGEPKAAPSLNRVAATPKAAGAADRAGADAMAGESAAPRPAAPGIAPATPAREGAELQAGTPTPLRVGQPPAPAPEATVSIQREPTRGAGHPATGRLALRVAEALAGVMLLGSVSALVLRRRRAGQDESEVRP